MKAVYDIRLLRDGLYAIKEQHSDNSMSVMMYLVVGSEKAALIDSGFGVTDNLRSELEQITDKPIVCLVGHGHPDHVGAAALFDEIYMNERDGELLPISLSYERRMGDVFSDCDDEEHKMYCSDHIVMPSLLQTKNLDDGDCVDLGGKILQVFAIPGHTQGSLAFYNEEEDYALTSDCFCPRTALVTLPSEKRVGITAYRDGLKRFVEAVNKDTALYWGHSFEPLSYETAMDMMTACTEVLDGKTENDISGSNPMFAHRKSAAGKRMMQHICGCVTLVYDANTL